MYMRLLLLLAVLLLPITLHAQAIGPKARQTQIVVSSSGSLNLLSGVALNASAATRTITLDTDNYDKVTVCFQATRSAYTAVLITPTCSIDDGVNYGSVPSVAVSSGTGTNSAYSDTFTSSSSISFCPVYATNNCTNMKFVFSGTSAGSSDLITVQARLGVGP